MNKTRIFGLLLILVLFLIALTPAQAQIIDITEEIDSVIKEEAHLKNDTQEGSICCCPVVSPCVWSLHCKCLCRRLAY